ncbi:protein of unknown function [Desulfacinum hydrothermale DSM 13146]|uniref:DUF1850 domain-containing protein n=1 Tax=Desulfacinum hydrothermale DSM 13146 TaxID=1121390 RepID=A0A1W1X777_9BACT|nr:DUF1850 domain-containing protein [Desulfacinum hydrothermale]SMC19667.1 protein of unknown function [Desulfacinum hydrothermale DSM 13146]
MKAKMFATGWRILPILVLFLSRPVWAGPNPAADPFLLRLTQWATQDVLLELPLRAHETFTIRYIHSVDHTPVFEVFELDRRGRLAIRETYFKMFGAGMGHWQGRGYVDFDGTWTWIRDIHQTLGRFILRVGSPGVDHTVLYRGREYNLSERWAGQRVVVEVVANTGS